MGECHSWRVEAVLLDVDGVLIDSLSVHREVWSDWARDHDLDLETVWQATFGRRPEDTVSDVAPDLELAHELAELDRLLARHERKIAGVPGAARLLDAVGELPWAIVTSGSRSVTIDRFKRLGLPLPHVATCGEDVQHGKPHPEPYLRACAELGTLPSHCVVVEDAPAGIRAGLAAGCQVLAVTTTHCAAACADAHQILADLSEVAEWIEQARGSQTTWPP